MKFKYLIFIFLIPNWIFAQSGGKGVYPFLNLPFSAKVAALGGYNVSLDDKDPNLTVENPSYISKYADKTAVFNYIWYLAGINYGNFLYNFKLNTTDNAGFGVKYINYGSFEGRDNSGVKQATFTAADYALDLIWNRSLIDSTLSIGVNVKPIYSQMAEYSSFGIAGDIGIFYRLHNHNMTLGLVAKNLGKQIKAYSTASESIQPDIQIGISKKLEHAPFRFSIAAYHLLDYQLDYDISQNQTTTNGFGTQTNSNNLITRSLKHFIFAVEFLPSNSFSVNLGYNYLRRTEMSLEGLGSMAGFSFGFSIKLSKFMFSYGRSAYHLAGGSDLFSLVYKL